jgi:hypothetical protein
MNTARGKRLKAVAGLDAAAAILRITLPLLDRSSEKCGACGLNKKSNWSEHQAGEEVEGMIRKLEKWRAAFMEDSANG